jgi:protein-tyrosine phosphatase
MEAGESCLIHSVNGKSRACAVLVAYMMKKYSWSLSKCLEFINLKKEGLEIRNNYLAQMQELEKRMLGEAKLSNSWNEIKNEEDLILANTYYNSKRSENKQTTLPPKKQTNKKISWNEKLVQRQNNLSATLGGRAKEEQPASQFKLRSILKGDQDEEKEECAVTDQPYEKEKASDGFISSINGNIVHVTVNNFINTDKKPAAETPVKVFNTRPFSSDAKEREKKNGSQEIRNPVMTYDRPTSANINQDRRRPTKPPAPNNPLAEKLPYDMMITGSNSKKRYPSSNPKEDSFKWK